MENLNDSLYPPQSDAGAPVYESPQVPYPPQGAGIEKKLKLITLLLICTLAISAAALVIGVVPFPGRVMTGDFRGAGQFTPGIVQERDGSLGQSGRTP